MDDTTHDAMLDLIDAALAPDNYPRNVTSTEAAEAIHPDRDPAEVIAELHPELAAWSIDGERTALWAANKLARAETLRKEAKATADGLRAAADAHEANIERRTAHDVTFFTGALRQYHETQIAGTKRKTTALPMGHKLASAKGSVSTVIDDEKRAELAVWLEDNAANLVEYPDPKMSAAGIKKAYDTKVGDEPGDYPAITDDGEIVPGVTFHRGDERFTITLGDPDAIDPDNAE